MRIYRIEVTSMLDVFSNYGNHSYIRQLAETWRQEYMSYKKDGGDIQRLAMAKETCLTAVKDMTNLAMIDIDRAMERPLDDDILPSMEDFPPLETAA